MRLSSGWEQSVYVLLMLNQLPEGKYINTISLSERLEVALSKPLSQITFYDVFVAIEGKNRIFESQNLLKKFLGNEESKKAKRCVVTNSLDIIENTLVATLTSITLSQVAHQSEINYDLTDIRNWVNKCQN